MCDMSIYLYLYMYVYIFMLLYVCSHPHMGHPRRGVVMSFGLGRKHKVCHEAVRRRIFNLTCNFHDVLFVLLGH